jgi:hypothetical protein
VPSGSSDGRRISFSVIRASGFLVHGKQPRRPNNPSAGHVTDVERALHTNDRTSVDSRRDTAYADTLATQDEHIAEEASRSFSRSAQSSATVCVTRSDTDTTVASTSTSDTTACTEEGSEEA